MSKYYRNYIGITTNSQYDIRRELGGMANAFDKGLDMHTVNITGGNVGGGNGVAPGNGYRYFVFQAPGTLTVSCPPNGVAGCEIIVVGGGGGGGTGWYGGGGGAGGVIQYPNYTLKDGDNPVTVGTGGNGGSSGADSVYGQPDDPLTALGGGYGGPRGAGGSPGGSGGGVGQPNTPGEGVQTTSNLIPANSRTYGYGNDGGPQAYGAGGGGAGGAGGAGPQGAGGVGRNCGAIYDGPLIGYPALNPFNGFFGGGGAGGNYPGTSQPGGAGGGANAGASAVDNTGGGGGGGQNSGQAGGAGGDGIVIIRTPDSL